MDYASSQLINLGIYGQTRINIDTILPEILENKQHVATPHRVTFMELPKNV